MNDVRSFHKLASFYRRFHPCYSPNETIKKDVGFKWEEIQQKVFQALKDGLTHVPILALAYFNKSFKLKCDASNVGVGSCYCMKHTSLPILVKN
ncbi:Tf2-11, partial [Mucuna pruriens]